MHLTLLQRHTPQIGRFVDKFMPLLLVAAIIVAGLLGSCQMRPEGWLTTVKPEPLLVSPQ